MKIELYLRESALGALLVCAAAGAQTMPAQAPPSPLAQMPPIGQTAPLGWQARPAARPATAPRVRAVAEKSGVLSIGSAHRLRLEIDLGSVTIRTDSVDNVQYHVHLEADGNDPSARAVLDSYRVRGVTQSHAVMISAKAPAQNELGNFWVTYEVSVPRDFEVDVTTGMGNIQMQDSAATARLETGGGNITMGNVREATLDTHGGHIVVGNVAGNLHATTGGGHITASNIGGDAVLTTTGGHIHAGRIGGTAQLETGGGNISVDRASSRVTATSAAGQISFGEAAGAINAHTSGGGIRVLRVAGPMQLDSEGGSILLAQVENEVHASTGTGSITAWFAPSGKLINASELASTQGDIQIYLPRSLALTIDATVQSPAHKIVVDPALPMKVDYVTNAAGNGKELHGECKLNGGGEVLHLRTAAGNIHLVYADTLMNQQALLLEQQLRMQIAQAQDQMTQIMKFTQSNDSAELQEIMAEIQAEQAQMAHEMGYARATPVVVSPTGTNQPNVFYFRTPATPAPAGGALAPTAPAAAPLPQTPALAPVPPDQDPGTPEIWWMQLARIWYGGVKQEPAEQQRRCIASPRPEYPPIAQQAGIEGGVQLHVLIDKDGHVQEVWGISGEQVLVNAAIDAVRKWKYRPMLLDGKPVPVVTTVRLEFRLN